MSEVYRTLAVIPARAGSKGVPNKNIALLEGKPLISYTILAALESTLITDIVVSTDSDDIADVARELGLEVYFMRPAHLAQDSSLTAPVVAHAKKQMEAIKNCRYQAIILLQPTSPFRTTSMIDEAINKLKTKSCTSVVSVTDVNGYHPFRMKRIENGFLVNFVDQGFEDMRPRQVLPKVYIRDGAIYGIHADEFDRLGQLVTDSCVPIISANENAINIDSLLDFQLAENILKNANS